MSVRDFSVIEEPLIIFISLAAIPVTISHLRDARAETDVPYHPSYKGTVLFRNVFHGQLPATDYPKVNVGLVFAVSNIDLLLSSVLLLDVPCLYYNWWPLGMVLLPPPS